MADTADNDSPLPPKLDLSKRAAVAPATPAKAPTNKPADAPMPAPAPSPRRDGTTRMKLQADTPKPVVPKSRTAAATPLATPKVTPKAAPGSIRMQAKPKPLTANAPKTIKAKSVGAKPTALRRPKSISLKPAAPSAPAAGPKGARPGSKRETSKISLESATAPLSAAVAPKTIKIKPVAISPAAGSSTPPVHDPKRQTSRISLEAALGSSGDKVSTGPKTIRLKRPSEAPTIKAKAAPESAGNALNKTARIELPDADSDVSATQKRTIKVKRPSQRRSGKSVSVKRGTSESAAAYAAAPVPGTVGRPQRSADSVHWTFITASVAAMLVCCVLIYLLCAQVLGPNISLTELAYAAPDAELPWPGRLPRQ
jgi:hypothetical protein